MGLSLTLRLFLLLSSLNAVLCACPTGCQCQMSEILCSKISSFPTAVPPSTTALYISNSNIPSLQSEDLTDFANALGIFVVKDTTLREISPGTLDLTLNIRALMFTGTDLQDLPEALFQHLPMLASLTLSSNRLLVLRPKWFTSLSALNSLDLSRNNFTSIPVGIFHPLIELKNLMLTGNNISQLSDESLRGLTKVKILRLNRNSLREIPAGSLDDLVSLEELSLQDNLITYLQPELFSKTQHLQKLFLSNNRLTALSQGLLLNLPQLSQISLYENQLETLPPGVFGPMALNQLWLYDNKLSHLEDDAFQNLTQLRLLVLSRNQISYVSPGAFRGLEQLGEVSLHTNRLTSLQAGTFQGLPSLVNISLEHNFISSLPPGFLQGVSQLGQIDLRNNSLPNLPQEILDELSVANEVLLQQNPWRCDRGILPLRQWLRRNPSNGTHNVIVCDIPSSLNGKKISLLSDEALNVLSSTDEPAVTATEENRRPNTLHPKRSTASPTVEATTTSEISSNGQDKEGVVSRETQIIIIAVVCTVIIISLIACLLCYRRNRNRGSRNIGRRSKNNSVL